MKISCDCGKFKANMVALPRNTPGRLVCYCNDCQQFLKRINREELLDEYGGTEIIPAYPSEIEITQGKDQLKCYRLTENGAYRWATSCCNSPVANTKPGFPWAGVFHCAYTNQDTEALYKLGEIRSRIYGRDAREGAPYSISNKIQIKDMLVVIPFIIKGKIFKKGHNSPFLGSTNSAPLCKPEILEE